MQIAFLRLQNQHLISPFTKPEEVVSWLGAMQAQDFAAAKWAIGLRLQDATDSIVEQAFNEGKILRMHIMRATWHFVTPKDIRWILALTSPNVHKFNGYYYRKSGFTKEIFDKSNKIIQKALEGGNQLTRAELGEILKREQVPTQELGLTYTILQAELDSIICSGPKKEKQFTYMLLEERVSPTDPIERDEALGELTKRYFQSHGPAQLQDFTWWSGLTITDAKRGIEIAKLQRKIQESKEYWFTKDTEFKNNTLVYFIPPFDEYFVAYKDRSDILDLRYSREVNSNGGMIHGAIVYKGIVIGTWKRVFTKKEIIITVNPFTIFTKEEKEAIEKAGEAYGKFHKIEVLVKT